MINFLYNLKHNKYIFFIKKLIPSFIKTKIKSNIPNYYYLPTNLEKIPYNNYPLAPELNADLDINYQLNLKKQFDINYKQNSQMTYPDLIVKLKSIFKDDSEFNFLDIGGEKLDFYLDLKKNFINCNYYLMNKREINNVFKKIQLELKLKNFKVIDSIQECPNEIDFINLGSAIQYIQDYEGFLSNLKTMSKYILISGITLYDNLEIQKVKKNIIVKQINVHPSNYMFFFDKKMFINIFKNFKLIQQRNCLTDHPNHKNFKDYKNIQYMDLLFKKL
ncbi:hypothetical protein OAM83_00990 [Candidatus Pelagibacter sp.]|jgi:hypothetical protein|nr:hypothetical protein [Candidatus Pelagibacter sp.]|tara:strand:+ start:385 stop:1212 length:828 start_codon:yes stop_codon:yes gene_type:complete